MQSHTLINEPNSTVNNVGGTSHLNLNGPVTPQFIQRNSFDFLEADQKQNLLEMTPQCWKNMVNSKEFAHPA